ncbi:MAG TPA: response regulator [Pyrinomonadaceae bacterium]
MATRSYQRRILHLDGHWDTEDRIRELVEMARLNCELVTAKNGADALKLIQAEPFDLVIVDPWASEVTGFKICRYIAANKPAIPVFFYAQEALMNDRKFAEASGAAAFFLADDHEGLVSAMTDALADGLESNTGGRNVNENLCSNK